MLGCGRIGRMHAELLTLRAPGATCPVVYDVLGEAASAVAAELGLDAAASAQELIERDDVDAVAICTSTDTHVDLIVAAARAGKPIFCEKPLSLNLAEVDRGLEAVAAAGVPFMVGFNRRFDPSHREVRDRVAAGDVGDVHVVRITSRDPAPPPLTYIAVSGGIFCDMTIHDFDMARYVTGSEVLEVYAKGAVLVDPAIGEAGDFDTTVIVLTHANGAMTVIDNSRQAVYGYDQRVEVFGSQGIVSSDNPLVTTTTVRDGRGGRVAALPYFFLERYTQSYLSEWEAFVGMLRDGTPSPVGPADGRAPLVLGLAAGRSVAERRPVSVEEIT